MDSSFSFASSVLRFLAEKKDIPLKDIFMFWIKVKRRSNLKVLKNYSELMEKGGIESIEIKYSGTLSIREGAFNDITNLFPLFLVATSTRTAQGKRTTGVSQ